MSRENEATIVIKKRKVVAGDGHHGGAWKVAYADFVTAMMAFFLMMWLLSSTSEEQRKGIADYFSPRIPIAEVSGGGEALFKGETVFTTERLVAEGSGGKTDDEEGEEAHDPAAPPPPDETVKEEESAEAPTLAEALDALERAKVEVEDALNAFKDSQSDNELLQHLTLRVTPEGLVIELADIEGQPLFTTGSAEPSLKMRRLIEMVAPIAADLKNPVAVVGHTDSARFVNPERYGNWELSIDRANAARRLLKASGLPGERIEKVVGAADRDPLSDDPADPQNRRIGVILLRAPLNAPAAASSTAP